MDYDDKDREISAEEQAMLDAPEPGSRPGDDEHGWCHSCGTLQLGSHARYAPGSRWGLGWGCAVCDDEPWYMGVWELERRQEITPELHQACTDQVVDPVGKLLR